MVQGSLASATPDQYVAIARISVYMNNNLIMQTILRCGAKMLLYIP